MRVLLAMWFGLSLTGCGEPKAIEEQGRFTLGRQVMSVAWSPDGKTLAAGSAEAKEIPAAGLVKLWNVGTGEELTTFRHSGEVVHTLGGVRIGGIHTTNMVRCVAFSPDGKTLATATDMGVKLWDVASGQQTTLFGVGDVIELGKPDERRPPFCRAESLAFSPDGKLLATASLGMIELWDTAQRKQLLSIKPGGKAAVAFSPDGKILASAESNNRVHIWDVATGRQLAEDHAYMGVLRAVAFSPDGKTLAAGAEGGAKLWDVVRRREQTALRERVTLKGRLGPVYSVACSPDGKTLATASGVRTVKVWDMATGRERATLIFSTSGERVYSVAFSPDGKTLAAGGSTRVTGVVEGVVKLWDIAHLLNP